MTHATHIRVLERNQGRGAIPRDRRLRSVGRAHRGHAVRAQVRAAQVGGEYDPEAGHDRPGGGLMTRIVINACYGGFGVSIEAMKALVERGSDVIATVTMEEYTGGNILPSFLAELVDAGDGYQTQKWARSLFKDGLVYYIEREREGRTDPILVNVVEALGEMANGPH